MRCTETAQRLHSIIARNGFSVKRRADDRSRSFSRTGMIKGGVGIYTSGSTRMAMELGAHDTTEHEYFVRVQNAQTAPKLITSNMHAPQGTVLCHFVGSGRLRAVWSSRAQRPRAPVAQYQRRVDARPRSYLARSRISSPWRDCARLKMRVQARSLHPAT